MARLKGKHKPDSWIARQSYGLVGTRRYDKYRDKESDIIKGDRILNETGEKWVEQIHWIVDKNQRLYVHSEIQFAAKRRFTSHKQASREQWFSEIVVSDLETEPDQRPQRLSQGGWKPLCVLKSRLGDIKARDLTVEQGGCPLLALTTGKKQHCSVSYEIVLKVGAAKIDFELWYRGRKRSRLGDIEVDWRRDRDDDILTITTLEDILYGA